MSNFWRLTEKFYIVPAAPDGPYPTDISIEVTLGPTDYFGVPSDAPRTTLGPGNTQMEIDRVRMRAYIGEGALPALLSVNFEFPEWTVQVRGNVATFISTVQDQNEFRSALQRMNTDLPRFLSIQAGIFIEVTGFKGAIWNREIQLHKPIENTSVIMARAFNDERHWTLNVALSGPSHQSASYNRYELSSRYYYHALRLISPIQVNFSPNLVDGEVILNLVKCIEIMFESDNRQKIAAKLVHLGIGRAQFSKQIEPLLLVRSRLDVAHPNSGFSTRHERSVMRDFVIRSITNVTAILQMVEQKIRHDDRFLNPVVAKSPQDLAEMVIDIEKYLAVPPLDAKYACTVVRCNGAEDT